jgi:hypothetical protein
VVPRIPFRGVRNSWLIRARNLLLAALASSARDKALFSWRMRWLAYIGSSSNAAATPYESVWCSRQSGTVENTIAKPTRLNAALMYRCVIPKRKPFPKVTHR